jgi:hypothetical protein
VSFRKRGSTPCPVPRHHASLFSELGLQIQKQTLVIQCHVRQIVAEGAEVVAQTNFCVITEVAHPQFAWLSGIIRALSKFGSARPYIARFGVFSRLI